MKKINNRGQFSLEYAVLIIIVISALLAMRIFMARAVQEKYRQSADVFGQGEQYAKGVTASINLDAGTSPAPAPPPSSSFSCSAIKNTIAALTEQREMVKKQMEQLQEGIGKFEYQIGLLEEEIRKGGQNRDQEIMKELELRKKVEAMYLEIKNFKMRIISYNEQITKESTKYRNCS